MSMMLLLALFCGPLLAEDLILKDGRYLQVKILEHNESGVRVRNLANGGEIFIRWELLRPEDRDRLMVQFGLKEEEVSEITMPGVRIVTRTGDEYLGVPKEEFTVQTIPNEVVLIIGGRETPFRKESIRDIEWRDVPAVEAYTPEQLYKMKLDELKPAEDDLLGHWDLAKYCTSIGDHAHAVEHLLKVRAIDPIYRTEYVDNQLARLEVLVRNQRVVDAIRDARSRASLNRYADAIERLDQILSVTELDPQLRAEAELSKDWVLKRRYEYFKKLVRRDYYALMDNKLNKVARDEKMKLQEAQRYVRSELHKEIVADIASRHGLDAKKEVQPMWEKREIYSTRVAWYGSGTFIVKGPAEGAERRNQQLQRQMARQAQEQRSRNQGGQGGFEQPQLQLPKPPTKDEWWVKAESSARSMWLKAYFAQNGKSLEVVGGERMRPCPQCGGTGTEKTSGSQGDVIAYTCTRCHGHTFDVGVAFK
jgi:hypothetical protein